jgi:hypothetical protein
MISLAAVEQAPADGVRAQGPAAPPQGDEKMPIGL